MSPFVPLQQNPFPPLHSTPMAQALPHSIMYPAGQQQMHYLPQYYQTPYAQYAPSSYPERTLKAERRRPKYTRSKTGCLTCRKKKVKCDEAKPSCQRCCSSQLDCTWPEVPPPKKKAPSRKGRSPADHDYSTTTSDAGTSSMSPTEADDVGDGTPQPTFRPEGPSPSSEIEREGASAAASTGSLTFADPNMLQVGNGAVSGDRRHSEPHLVPSLAASVMETRRHSMADITDGQQYMHHHNSHHQQQHQGHIHNQSISSAANGALGLSLNQLGVGSSTRPSTPSEFLYPHSQVHGGQQGYPAFTPAGNVTIIPNISGGSTSSRPSTASSSLSFSHSLRRTPAGGSRPSTAGSHVSAYVHRPASSGSGTGTGDYPPLGYSPFSFQQPGRNPVDVSLDAVNVMNGGYANAGISRPSTASSAPSAAPSPYMRHGAMPLGDGSNANRIGSMGRWQESPLLAQPQPHTVDGMGTGGYFNQLMPSPPQHARTDSPAWAY